MAIHNIRIALSPKPKDGEMHRGEMKHQISYSTDDAGLAVIRDVQQKLNASARPGQPTMLVDVYEVTA